MKKFIYKVLIIMLAVLIMYMLIGAPIVIEVLPV